jgi:tetratricopeptide (TPR) repeat protein
MDFVDGLPMINDEMKRQTFEKAMTLRDENNHDAAIKKFRYLLSQNPESSQETALHILIGNTFLLKNDYDEALGHYKQALKIAEKAGNVSAKGVVLGNIGLIYSAKGDADKALEYLEKALEIFQSIGAEVLTAQVNTAIKTVKEQL